MHVAARRRRRRVQVTVRVDPHDAAGAVRGRHADERAECDRMVAAEHERRRVLCGAHSATSFATRSHSSRICGRKRARSSPISVDSATGACTLPRSSVTDAELLGQMLSELGVANRRRSHVDAAPILPQIERCADHDDLTIGWLHAHGSKANVPRRGWAAMSRGVRSSRCAFYSRTTMPAFSSRFSR